MRGRFSLNVHDMGILFGNLGLGTGNEDLYYVTDLTYQKSGFGFLIAHDVIEHTVKHRTHRYVTVAEEIRALGAAMFVRPSIDPTYDIINQLEYLRYTPEKVGMLSKREDWLDYFDPIVQNLEQDSEEECYHLAQWANDQLNIGYWQKKLQYDNCQSTAHNDFIFIQENSEYAAEQLKDRHWKNMDCSGISCTFDTLKGIFKTQYRWQ